MVRLRAASCSAWVGESKRNLDLEWTWLKCADLQWSGEDKQQLGHSQGRVVVSHSELPLPLAADQETTGSGLLLLSGRGGVRITVPKNVELVLIVHF